MARYSKAVLERQLKYARTQYEKKLAVARQHKPGTSWHTRAMLEAEGYKRRMQEIERQLRGEE